MKVRVIDDIPPANLALIGGFFATKVAVGAGIILTSARALSVEGFASFSQLFLLAGYMALLASGGASNGVIQRIAAARGEVAVETAIVRAALAFWAAASLILLAAGICLALPLSRLLVNDDRFSGVIPFLAATVALGGLGQVFTAVLTGRKHLAQSLGAQTLGLILGGIAAVVLLIAKRPAEAVLAFTAGPIVTTLLAGGAMRTALVRHVGGDWRYEFRMLLNHAAAFAAVAVIPPIVIFAVRGAYQEAFGLAALGYWLAANRISDISTQVMGLYLSQIFLPQMSTQQPGVAAQQYAVKTGLLGIGFFAVPLGVFLLAPLTLVGLFLGNDFYPAVPFIVGYMMGDMLRAVTAVTMMTALAHARPRLYMSVELIGSAIFALVTLVLITHGVSSGPWLGYVAGHLAISLAVSLWLIGRRKNPQ